MSGSFRLAGPLVLLLATGCVTAAAGGAYVAVRQNQSAPTAQSATVPSPATGKAEAAVAETEAIVTPPAAVEAVNPASSQTRERAAARVDRPAPSVRKESASAVARKTTADAPRAAANAASSARDASPVVAGARGRACPGSGCGARSGLTARAGTA